MFLVSSIPVLASAHVAVHTPHFIASLSSKDVSLVSGSLFYT